MKADYYKNNAENSSTAKACLYYSISPISAIKSRENKHNVYRSKDCKRLREHAQGIINFENKNIKLLIESNQNHVKIQIFYIC